MKTAAKTAAKTSAKTAAQWRRELVPMAVVAALAWGGSQWWNSAADGRAAERVAALAKPGDIVMLSSVTCAYCEQARRWFAERRVPFSECLIERDAACAAAYQAALAPGTPTLLVRGQRQVGFSPAAVAEALQAPKTPTAPTAPLP